MLSKALSHFPQFRYRNGQKRLWNPILKKTFAIRPEERVRLAIVDYLTLEAGFSTHRISFESPVKLTGDKSSSRTDIICFTNEFKPLLLVECKAPEIKLDEKAAIQVARYNQKVEAPYILVSNGLLDFWFEIEEAKIRSKKEIPNNFRPKNKSQRNLSYWQERCFIGQKLPPEVRKFAKETCLNLFENPHQPIKYLSFSDFSPELALGHYYRIFGMKGNVKVAISLSANHFGDTRLNAVLNLKGENTAFSTTSLNLMADGDFPATEIHSAKGIAEVDLKKEAGFTFQKRINDIVSDLHKLLIQYS